MTKLTLPWGARFELTDFARVAAAMKGKRGVVFVDQEGRPRKMNGDLTSCPSCCTFPCSCEPS